MFGRRSSTSTVRSYDILREREERARKEHAEREEQARKKEAQQKEADKDRAFMENNHKRMRETHIQHGRDFLQKHPFQGDFKKGSMQKGKVADHLADMMAYHPEKLAWYELILLIMTIANATSLTIASTINGLHYVVTQMASKEGLSMQDAMGRLYGFARELSQTVFWQRETHGVPDSRYWDEVLGGDQPDHGQDKTAEKSYVAGQQAAQAEAARSAAAKNTM